MKRRRVQTLAGYCPKPENLAVVIDAAFVAALAETETAIWNGNHQLHGRGDLCRAITHAKWARSWLACAERLLARQKGTR